MKFDLEKTTVLELDSTQINQVAGGTNTYASCIGTCNCPSSGGGSNCTSFGSDTIYGKGENPEKWVPLSRNEV